MINLKTIYRPSNLHLEIIKNHLVTEKMTGNISSVVRSFENNTLIVLFEENELIGFSAYHFDTQISKINILEIVMKYRNNGLGKKLAHSTLKQIKKNQGEIVELMCFPPCTISFWKKVGFKKQSKTEYDNNYIIMRKSLSKK